MPRQPHRGDGEGDAHQQHQALGDQRHQAGGRRLRRLVEVDAADREARPAAAPPAGPSRSWSPLSTLVDLDLKRRGRMAERPAPRRRPAPRSSARGPRRPRSSRSPRGRTSPRATGRPRACGLPSDSPVSIDSSMVRPREDDDHAVGDELVAGLDPDTSPGTTSSARSSIGWPSRTAFALGATRSARWSSVSFAFSSWRIPIAELITAISPNRASANRPSASMRTKKAPEDGVEEREDVAGDDARDRAAAGRLRHPQAVQPPAPPRRWSTPAGAAARSFGPSIPEPGR